MSFARHKMNYLISRWRVWRRRAGLYFLISSFSGLIFVFLDALEGFLNFIDGILVGREQAKGEIAVKIIRARIGHVQAVAGHFLSGFLGQTVHLVEEPLPQIEEVLVVSGPLRLDFDLVR